MTEDKQYDLTIIGGGPAGLYAAFYAGMRGMSVKLIESKSELGGFLRTYPEKMIWDVGGIPPIRCDRLIEWLSRQAVTFDPTLVFGQQIDRIDRLDDGSFLLESRSGDRHFSRTVLLAVGRGVTEPQKLEIEGADRYELTNLHYTVQETEPFRGKRVLLSGGGNSAVDWALQLAETAARVTVVHQREEFRAMERNIEQMHELADVRTPYRIVKLHGRDDKVTRVTLAHVETGAEDSLEVDAVIVNHGYKSDYGGLLRLGLPITDGMLQVNERTETPIPGLFAAGDCCGYPSKVRLIAGAFTDAILAVGSAKRHLEPGAAPFAYVSSHNELFRERNKRLHRSDRTGEDDSVSAAAPSRWGQ